MKKQPEKTAQTKQSLINAFWDIAEKRGLNNVTISEVTKRAELNRGTFYVYFTDIDDLLYQAEQDIIADIRSKLASAIENEGILDLHSISTRVIEIFGLYDDKLFMLLGKEGDPMFLDLVRKEAASVFSTAFKVPADNPYQDYVIAYITSGFTGILQFWHETGKELSLQELSAISHGMVLHGVTGLKSQTEKMA